MKNNFNQEIHIGPRTISEGGRVFIIAEAGINHNGDIDMAKRLVDMSVAAGADAVKFQTFVSEETVTKKLQKVEYQKSSTDDHESFFDMIKRWEFDKTQWYELFDYCTQKGIVFLSTPSEEVSARLLYALGVPAFKIASNDLVTTAMLEEVAAWGKPMIISTGMGNLDEIQEALDTIARAGNTNIIVLQCTSSYPTPLQELNLRTITTLKETFGTLVGFSDHSEGITAAPLAVLLGAVVVEKHITLDKTLPGPDQSMALNSEELTAFIATIRNVEELDAKSREKEIAKIPNADGMLGNPEKKPTSAEVEMRKTTRKGIVARRALKVGEVIELGMIAFKQPYEGIPAREYKSVIGKRVTADIVEDEFLTRQKIV